MNKMGQTHDLGLIWEEWIAGIPSGFKSGNEEEEWLERDYFQQPPERQRILFDAMLHAVLSESHMDRYARHILADKLSLEHRRQILKLYQNKLRISHKLSDYVDGVAKYKPYEVWEEENSLAELIGILSFEPTNEFVKEIRYFYLDRPIAPIPIFPKDELFHTHPDLFLRGWERILSQISFEEWRGYGTIQWLLGEPDIIVALKLHLSTSNLKTWGLLKQALLGWLDTEYIDGVKLDWPSRAAKAAARSAIVS